MTTVVVGWKVCNGKLGRVYVLAVQNPAWLVRMGALEMDTTLSSYGSGCQLRYMCYATCP